MNAIFLFYAGAAIASNAQVLTTLASFEGTDGALPYYGSLIQATDGNLYGTASAAGMNGYGTIFKVTPGGTLTTLYNFSGTTDGSIPYAGLVQATDGNFYGAASAGGTTGGGTIFKITPGGTLTVLYTFGSTAADAKQPEGTLIQATDGNLYGTALSYGLYDAGAIFKITTGGAFTTLYSFEGLDGAYPAAGLIQGSDGNFYGTTWGGGPSLGSGPNGAGFGTVFKISPAGTFTKLHGFESNGDGANPFDGLCQATDGNFYGTTSGGGTAGLGTVFKITPDGTLTTMYSFTGVNGDGSYPQGAVIEAADGNFYGTTALGGVGGLGTIFKMTPAGAITILHSFNSADGSGPNAGLIQGTDGKLYGTTNEGGVDDEGTVFSFSMAGSLLPSINAGGIISASAFGGFQSVAPGSWIEIYGSNLAIDTRTWAGSDFNGINAPTSLDGTSVTIGGQPAFVSFISQGQVDVQVPSSVATGSQQVILTTAAGDSNTYTLTVDAAEPGLLAPASFIVSGNQYVAALFPDYSTFAVPTGALPNVTSRPAQPGDTLIIYGIGFGDVSPGSPAGEIVQQQNMLAAPFHLYFGNVEASLEYAGLSPGYVGLYQFNVLIPDVPGSDLVPLTFTLNGIPGTQKLYIAVQGSN